MDAALFGWDMLFDIPYLADWFAIGQWWQQAKNCDAERLNKKHLDHKYTIGQKVLLLKNGVLQKAEDKYTRLWTVIQVHCTGTVRIQHGTVSQQLNIKEITPFFE